MRAITYLWRMALRRKTTCLLVLIFTMAITIFMLTYPNLIQNTRNKLNGVYDSLEVRGWILNSEDFDDPVIPGGILEEMEASDYFSEISVSGQFAVQTIPKDELKAQAGTNATAQEELHAFHKLIQNHDSKDFDGVGGTMLAYNRMEASDGLLRIQDKIHWETSYDERFLEGKEHVCLLSEEWGYAPGDTVHLLARTLIEDRYMEGIIRMKVIGTYPGKVTDFAAVMPIRTYEELCTKATKVHQENDDNIQWPYTFNSLYFTIKENRQLLEAKEYMVGKGFDGTTGLRVAVDDRVLKGTASPIESNLSLLENLYFFFYGMIICIAFFLSFLLAKGRKGEYAVMRLLGEGRWQITLKMLLEQGILCLLGIIFAAVLVGVLSSGSPAFHVCGLVFLCYGFGSAIAVLLTVRVDVMDILQEKE